MSNNRKPRLAVYKFSSCDGCQLSLLDCEDELLEIAGEIEIAYFVEARSQTLPGPYDLTLVEGSVTTEEEIERIEWVRHQSRFLVPIGACATAGGIQALRNWTDVDDYLHTVYPSPEYIQTLETSKPINDYVEVDFELPGCPISQKQLLELITSILIGRQPCLPAYTVCRDCKSRGTVCVIVSQGIPCLGPVTRTGCGAICPSYNRGCYGCFGPIDDGNPYSLGEHFKSLGYKGDQISRHYRNFNSYSSMFRKASDYFEGKEK